MILILSYYKSKLKIKLVQILVVSVVFSFAHSLFAVDSDTLALGADSNETMVINSSSAACPDKCMKNSKCDKSCRSRDVAEKQMIEKIMSVYKKNQDSVESAHAVAIDQNRFCPKESIAFKNANNQVIFLPIEQGFKGSFSDFQICNSTNGYHAPPTPANLVEAPQLLKSNDPDGCYEYSSTYTPTTVYSTPVVVGPVRFQCDEDKKTKTMSWKLISSCRVETKGQPLEPKNIVHHEPVQIKFGGSCPEAVSDNSDSTTTTTTTTTTDTQDGAGGDNY